VRPDIIQKELGKFSTLKKPLKVTPNEIAASGVISAVTRFTDA
jgi:hypothetical protein